MAKGDSNCKTEMVMSRQIRMKSEYLTIQERKTPNEKSKYSGRENSQKEGKE